MTRFSRGPDLSRRAVDAPIALGCFQFLFFLLHLVLHVFDLDALLADVEAQMSVEAHVLIGDPHQGKSADQISAPVRKEQLVAREPQEKDGHIMAEAEFTGKKEEKLAKKQPRVRLALSGAVIPGLTKDLFMGYGPGHGRNGDRQQKEPQNLQSNRHPWKEGFSEHQVALDWNSDASLLHH